MKFEYTVRQTDYGQTPYVTNISCKVTKNSNFRTALWTGCHLQMTLMCIPVCSDIGLEIHKDTDQIIHIEQGTALVKMGTEKQCMPFQEKVCPGDCIFIPACTWHNIINIGNIPLKLSSVYGPSHHPKGTVQPTKKDAENAY